MVICTDPGHGGADPGASYNGVLEKDVNLQSALILNDLLKKRGHRVFTTRTDDITVPPLLTRTKLINAHHSSNNPSFDLIVSIHCNAAGRLDTVTNNYVPLQNVRGLYVVYSCESVKSTCLAESIHDVCKRESIQLSHNGIISTVELGRTLAWIHKTLPVSVLIELGYLTCPDECALLGNSEYLTNVMTAIADGIESYENKQN